MASRQERIDLRIPVSTPRRVPSYSLNELPFKFRYFGSQSFLLFSAEAYLVVEIGSLHTPKFERRPVLDSQAAHQGDDDSKPDEIAGVEPQLRPTACADLSLAVGNQVTHNLEHVAAVAPIDVDCGLILARDLERGNLLRVRPSAIGTE